MRVLVIGSGAREHALVARLSADRDVGELLAAPGNPGIARLARTVPLDAADVDAALALADREQIDFTIVGPELPLSIGVVGRIPSGVAGKLATAPFGLQGSPPETLWCATIERQFQRFASLASHRRAGTMTPQRSGHECPGRQKHC